MNAYAIDELGRPGSVRELPDPEPGEREVRIRVAAAGLNPFDASVLAGYLKDHMEHRFPLIPGNDASGTVDAVGDGVDDWAVGDEVFGGTGKMSLGEGTLAQLATMSAGTIARKPASIGHADAAAIPVAGATALVMADAMAIADGDVVVVVGATGGVGSYLVQLAARRGARVVGVCSAANADYARDLGAADVIDYHAGDVADAVRSRHPDRVAAVADLLGDRDLAARLAEQVRSGGHVVSAVGSADVDALGERGIAAVNVRGDMASANLATLADMLDRGELKSPEIRAYPLEQAAEGLAAVASGHVRGKIVVQID